MQTDKLLAAQEALFDTLGAVPESFFVPTHCMLDRRERTLLAATDLLKTHPEALSSVLDLGCGFGDALNYLPIKPTDYYGVDLFQKGIDAAKEKHPTATFYCDDAVESTLLPRTRTILVLGLIQMLSLAQFEKLLHQLRRLQPEHIILEFQSSDTYTGEFNAYNPSQMLQFLAPSDYAIYPSPKDSCLVMRVSYD